MAAEREAHSQARSVGGVSIETSSAPIGKIALLGNHLPRQCGIATFTTDLCEALSAELRPLDCFVLAMNDPGQRHAYPASVRFEIDQAELAAYGRAADFLNVNPVDIVSVQHEYGIFGGKAGSHVLALLANLRMPVVSTLHTILAEPVSAQKSVLTEICRRSDRVVVMSRRGRELLQQVYGVPESKIDLIPHGTPAVPAASQGKARLGVEGRPIILTFGLLSPDKGIEHVIDAMPAILERFPDAIYIVIGATHPHIREHSGEAYRLMLELRARALGVDHAMIFHNRFVSKAELVEFLSAADVYVTPYLKEEQITSGTLAYAVGLGKAAISTPYLYARELLAEGRGVLVPWRDHRAIGTEIIDLLGNETKRLEIGRRAAEHAASMAWPAVARCYGETFLRAIADHQERLHRVFQARTLVTRPILLPELELEHLTLMTDQTGMLQHAIFGVPRYEEGYCLDDNSRALLLTALLEETGEGKFVRALASRYLAFVSFAFNARLGRFRNFLSYSRQWMEEIGSEDCHGRALWALGTVVGRRGDPGRQALARSLLQASLPAVEGFTSPRAWAYTLLGISEYLRPFGGDRQVQALRVRLANRLLSLFGSTCANDWPWFEEQVSYCNARLPQALLVSGAAMEHVDMMRAGLRSLEWLVELQVSPEGYFSPVGSNGFYRQGGARASYDQQPVEACGMVSACLEAGRLTGDAHWVARARRAFDWFLGQNQLQRPLFEAATGGCRDGLHADRVNENQGAESTLSFLLALTEMRATVETVTVELEARQVQP